MIRAKKPWAAAAAAAVLLGIAAFHTTASGQLKTAIAAKDAGDKSKFVIENDTKYKGEFNTATEQLRQARRRAEQILRGGEERTNWSILHRYINDCLPQPNGDTISNRNVPNGRNPLNPLEKYYTDAAQRAYATKKAVDEEGRQDVIDWNNLVQINIQGIYTRYCDTQMSNHFYEYVKK